MINAQDALQQLEQGNERARSGASKLAGLDAARLTETAAGQKPFAVVIGCADSRVPPELVFDQDIGELFTIRVAGNVITATQLGSIEFAVGNLGVRLIVVLGHSGCGAVRAAVQELQTPRDLPPNLSALVDCIKPALQDLPGSDTFMEDAVRANARHSAALICEGIESAEAVSIRQAADDDVVVVAAVYDLATGRVLWL